MTIKKITLDVWEKNSVFVTAVQGEVASRFLEITITDGDSKFDLTDKAVQIYFVKADGSIIYNSAEILDTANGLISIDLTEQMSSSYGIYKTCEIHIIDSSSHVLKVCGLSLIINKSLDENTIESLDEYVALNEAMGNMVSINSHLNSKNNPHNVNAEQIGAIASSEKDAINGVATLNGEKKLVQMPNSTDIGAIPSLEKGAINGVATLNSNGKLQSNQLDTSSDSYKIKLINLSEEVQNAMAGTTAVISSVADGSLTTEKYADNSVTSEKLAPTTLIGYNISDAETIGVRTSIPANSDLNAYTTVGNYCCPSSVTAGTILNNPGKEGFILNVGYSLGVATANRYLYQELKTYTYGNKYYRYLNSTNPNTGWTDWIKTYNTSDFTTDKSAKNLYNPESPDIVEGGYYNTSGVYVADARYSVSGFIPVTPGLNYAPNYLQSLVTWWDSDKNFVSYTGSSTLTANGYVTAPAEVSYARFGFTPSIKNRIIVQGRSIPDYTAGDGVVIPELKIITQNTSEWQGKKWTSFGDSLTAQENWQGYVVSKLGLVHTNCGVGGSALGGNLENCPYGCFWENSRINAIKESDPDMITILGGANDLQYRTLIGEDSEFTATLENKDKSTFKGSYSYIIETLLAWKPTLKIFLLPSIYGSGIYGSNSTTHLTWRDYAQATRDVADFYNLKCIDISKECGINFINRTTYLKDTVHPNLKGGLRIAQVVISHLGNICLH